MPLKDRTIWDMDGGSGIIGPDGKYVDGPVYKEETILYAEIDPEVILKSKWKIDTVGHYSRSDVVQLVIQGENRKA